MATSSLVVYIYFGFVVAAIATILFFWFYWADFIAFTAFRYKSTDAGASKKEIIIMLVLGIIEVVSPFYILLAQPDWFGPKPIIDLVGAGIGKSDSGGSAVNIVIRNGGTLSADGQTYREIPIPTDEKLGTTEIDRYFIAMKGNVEEMWPTRSNTDQMQPNENRSFPALVPESKFGEWNKKYVYVLFLYAYEDSYLPRPKYRITEECIYFINQNNWRSCDHHHGNTYIHE